MVDSNSEKEAISSTRDSLSPEEGQVSDIKAQETTSEATTDVSTKEPEPEYITGLKLFLVLVGCGMVVFLMQLDQTIVVTVSCLPSSPARIESRF